MMQKEIFLLSILFTPSSKWNLGEERNRPVTILEMKSR